MNHHRTVDRLAFGLGLSLALAVPAAAADTPAAKTAAPAQLKKFTLTTQSQAARDTLAELQKRIESFQGGPANAELARTLVAADPEFALGSYYMAATTPPPDNQKHLEKAVELAKKASDGERRFIEAIVLARGKTPADAIAPFTKLAQDYPDERIVHMQLGQLLAGDKRLAEARAEYEKAIALDPSTPRAHALLGHLYVVGGDYAKGRATYESALKMLPARVAPGQLHYGIAFTYLYEGNPDAALTALQGFVEMYKQAGPGAGLPEVFIWNSMGRINLENGRYEEALKAYQKGYESVPGSTLDEVEKKIWLGRLHHGTGRTLARMKRFDDAWKEAATIRKMIDEGGERGKEFEPSYHYLAGYIKLEQGDLPGAIDDLKQTTEDPFHRLLLARAYEKAGDKENAKKTYEWVVNYSNNTLDRALSYQEARKKLERL
jgi:tetratricopeptide (TPR) repeat protein